MAKTKKLYDVIYKDYSTGEQYSAYERIFKMIKSSWDDEESEQPWKEVEKELKQDRESVLQSIEYTKEWFDAVDYDFVKAVYK